MVRNSTPVPTQLSLSHTTHHLSPPIPRITPEAIRARAQELYRRSGCRDGLCEFNWFQAQRELLMEALNTSTE